MQISYLKIMPSVYKPNMTIDVKKNVKEMSILMSTPITCQNNVE